MVLGVVLLSELLGLTFALVRPAVVGFLFDFARLSMLMQWLGLTSAGLICLARGSLRRLTTPLVTGAVVGIVLLNILALSIGMVWLGRWWSDGVPLDMFPGEVWPFALRNMLIGVIVTLLLLRYFFVIHQWRRHVESEARSRADALQARIRPHFLFNSMNTIASLTRSDPKRAEEAVEDLADLFRVTLKDEGRLLTLGEEIELSRIYQRIEARRLGGRLQVDWDLARLPMGARLPALTIQPLLENAIYHGIEPLEQGGTVTIGGRCDGEELEITVSNPTEPHAGDSRRRGNRIAVENIRERLSLAFAGRGKLEVERTDSAYNVRLRFPLLQ
jgi:two-component system sensor histidine kinase AlgZ